MCKASREEFGSLAKVATGLLASELAGDEEAYNRLQAWLQGDSHTVRGGRNRFDPDHLGPQSPATDEAGQVNDGSLLSETAAEYLGLDGFELNSVQAWLNNPDGFEDKDDTQMIGALIYRLLQALEEETGEGFEGTEQQYDWLASKASSVLGGALSKEVVQDLVNAYLAVAQQ
ncbi:hypothetical protein N2152v2_004033 [Parachlorella kessleri]